MSNLYKLFRKTTWIYSCILGLHRLPRRSGKNERRFRCTSRWLTGGARGRNRTEVLLSQSCSNALKSERKEKESRYENHVLMPMECSAERYQNLPQQEFFMSACPLWFRGRNSEPSGWSYRHTAGGPDLSGFAEHSSDRTDRFCLSSKGTADKHRTARQPFVKLMAVEIACRAVRLHEPPKVNLSNRKTGRFWS